jgi:hypothetical protein
MTHDGARILRDWLDQHLPEHPAVPADLNINQEGESRAMNGG